MDFGLSVEINKSQHVHVHVPLLPRAKVHGVPNEKERWSIGHSPNKLAGGWGGGAEEQVTSTGPVADQK